MQITERASKAEIISAACELVDDQSARIEALQQRQAVLWTLVALLAVGCLF